MKFATNVVIFLSSSFAFVKGEEVECTEWPSWENCPGTTTKIYQVHYEQTGPLPTEIGHLTQLTEINLSMFWGGSMFFDSTITYLTTHVWFNCASTRHDRWQLLHRNHPHGVWAVDKVGKTSSQYVFGVVQCSLVPLSLASPLTFD